MASPEAGSLILSKDTGKVTNLNHHIRILKVVVLLKFIRRKRSTLPTAPVGQGAPRTRAQVQEGATYGKAEHTRCLQCGSGVEFALLLLSEARF